MRRLHYLQHVPFEDIGTIRNWAETAGMTIKGTRLFDDTRLPSVDEFDWIVIMGGPMNVDQEDLFPWLRPEKKLIRNAVEQGKTVVGICLGAQLVAEVMGAVVRPNIHREIGWFPVYKTGAARQSDVSAVIPEVFQAVHWHGDTFDLPDGAVHLGRSEACENQAFVLGKRVVGLQFHLEMTTSSLEKLIDHCRSDLDESPFVQRPADMLADRTRFKEANAMLDNLLDRLADGGC
jgi:GMP synthase (glutamine-hydrolysing)